MFSEVVLGIKSLRTTDDTRPTIYSDAISCNILFYSTVFNGKKVCHLGDSCNS